MKKEYNFSDSIRNPYAKHLKKQVTLRLNTDAITYFKALAKETGIPYQNLINLYLTECAHSGKETHVEVGFLTCGCSGSRRRPPLTRSWCSDRVALLFW